MLVARSSRCATRDIVRNTVSRQARATLATAGDHPAQRTTTNTTEPNHLVTSGSRRVFFLRPWVGVPSMALGLAVLRAFELQYGKLRDIRLGQDFEVAEMYQSAIWANFEDDRDYDNIPLEETVIKLAIPTVPKSPPGTTPLAEVQPFLLPLKNADRPDATPWDSVLESMKKVSGAKPEMMDMDVKIGRSVKMTLDFVQFLPDAETRPTQQQYNKIGAAFCKWGGFYTPDQSQQPKVKRQDDTDDPPAKIQDIAPHMPYMSAVKHFWTPVMQVIAEKEMQLSQEMEQNEREQREQEEREQEQEQQEQREREQKEREEAAVKEAEAAVTEEVEVVLESEQTGSASSKPIRQPKRERLLALARSGAAKPITIPQPAGPRATAENATLQSTTIKETEVRLTRPQSSTTKEDQKRSHLAAVAHRHAHSPLPQEVIPGDPKAQAEAQRAAEEKKRADDQAAKATVLDRLKKLWGW